MFKNIEKMGKIDEQIESFIEELETKNGIKWKF